MTDVTILVDQAIDSVVKVKSIFSKNGLEHLEGWWSETSSQGLKNVLEYYDQKKEEVRYWLSQREYRQYEVMLERLNILVEVTSGPGRENDIIRRQQSYQTSLRLFLFDLEHVRSRIS